MNKKNNEINEIWKSLATQAEQLNCALREIIEINKELLVIKKELLKLKNKEIN